ncbi:hypothetical protein INT48_005555 [Thamnidium elegans]|uniref:Uncharacterized protein n=1 Tax=Thamnidium elegans TaxID=101142 RepID=A0A8H7W3T2_9FUNG|nr:hypothetical protein INT48_005555 [Thamnidium elegans]
MAKAKKTSTIQKTPYNRNKKTTEKKNTKPLTKSEKLKNADLIDDLDNLMDDLTPHLVQKKKKAIQIKNDDMEESYKIEQEQRLYEKTQNDMEDALGLLTKL